MHPVADHTLQELQILSDRHHDGSIFNYFNKTVSYGGRDLLKSLIKNPKQSQREITSVQELLKSMSGNIRLWEVNISHAYIAATESYFSSNIAHTMSQDVVQHWFQTMMFSFRNPHEYFNIESGLTATIKFFRALQEMVYGIQYIEIPSLVKEDLDFLTKFLDSFVIKRQLIRDDNRSKTSVFYLDYYLRIQRKEAFRKILDIYYLLDAYLAIAKTTQEVGLSFPEFSDNAAFEAEKIWHPLISGCVKNTFSRNDGPGICILTGANTSGKTTFLKSIAVVIYLAHLGWPVPAANVRLAFTDKLFTSIHLSDNIDLGYSHFYNEVMRIKEIALALHQGEKCFVIIDELFRGTNQEDALHCSETVLDGFANFKTSQFIVSTHLLELLEKYLQSPAISFQCFKTTIIDRDFENTFLLEPGIASEKVGKLIMDKVGIPELLATKKPSLS